MSESATIGVDETAAGRRPTETGQRCQACEAADVALFHEVEGVPVHNSLLLPTRDAALGFPRGELRLGHCPACGFIQNVAFDPSALAYGPGYEDSQAHSERFSEFAEDLARSLIDRYDARGADVVEVGCGKGDFLDLLCRLGDNRGVGFDPAPDPGELPRTFRHVAETFDDDTAVTALDLLVCRHTLEHVPDVRRFAAMLARHLGRHPKAAGYIEVPDTARVLAEGALWDLYYEHCSYFTLSTLCDLAARSGLRVARASRGFDDQYLQIDVTAGDAEAESGRSALETGRLVERFGRQSTPVIDRWRGSLRGWADAGRRVVLWGGGSKAVGFLTTLGHSGLPDDTGVAAVVDINPRKQGRFLPGTGHEVIAPSDLPVDPPDVVIVMNPVYLSEISGDLRDRGLAPEVVAA
jgi:SAM-dependent methyltransferase